MSALKQLKAELAKAGLSRQSQPGSTSKKRKRATTGEQDRDKKVAKLQRASLSNPVRVEVNEKYVILPSSWHVIINFSQVLHCGHPAPVLPLHSIEPERRQSRQPCEHAGAELHHHLHEDSS